MSLKEDIIKIFSSPSLQDALEKDCHVDLAILFGSAASGRQNPRDLDLAFLFREHLSGDQEERLLGLLRSSIQVDRLDVVCLNHADCSLRYEAIRNGTLLYESESARYADFITRTFKDYEEMNFLKRHYHRAKIEELRRIADV
ncbi:MAG: nucleotidyltransferase domain-containing protein [Deltaproteobacteria bacterium]|nr:nucleotidyltransferase domain-containing protein [Deltaproteobacteria bacterium]